MRETDFKYIVKFRGMPKPIVCPAFWELRWAYGCPYGCEYCYLLGTLYGKKIIPYDTYLKRREVLERELPAFFEAVGEPTVLNSGELADSLMFEKTELPFIPWATEIFKQQDRHKHLILTKGTSVQNLIEVGGQKNTIYSASVNPEEVWRWEVGTPSPKQRLAVARMVQNAGYEVRVRIDFPIRGVIPEFVDTIYRHLAPSRLTLGTPRINNARLWKYGFWQELKSEMDYIGWGKWRYKRETSKEIYEALIDKIRAYDPEVPISLCKETEEMWGNVGLNPNNCKCNCVL